MRIANDTLIDAPVTLTQDWESPAFYLGHIVNYSIQLVFTGTPDGTFSLQCSNDKGLEDKTTGGWNGAGVSNWTEITGSASVVTGADTIMWDVQNAGYRWVRVVYDFSASTGSLTSAICNAKGV